MAWSSLVRIRLSSQKIVWFQFFLVGQKSLGFLSMHARPLCRPSILGVSSGGSEWLSSLGASHRNRPAALPSVPLLGSETLQLSESVTHTPSLCSRFLASVYLSAHLSHPWRATFPPGSICGICKKHRLILVSCKKGLKIWDWANSKIV